MSCIPGSMKRKQLPGFWHKYPWPPVLSEPAAVLCKLLPGEMTKSGDCWKTQFFATGERKENPADRKKEKLWNFGTFGRRSGVRQAEMRLRRHMQVEQNRTNKKLKNINYWEDVCRIR